MGWRFDCWLGLCALCSLESEYQALYSPIWEAKIEFCPRAQPRFNDASLHHSACIEQDVLSVGLKVPVMFSLGILCLQRPQIKSPSPRRTGRRRKPLSTLAAHNTARVSSAYQSQLVLLDHHHPIVRLPVPLPVSSFGFAGRCALLWPNYCCACSPFGTQKSLR